MRKKASRPLDGSPFVFFGVTLSAQSDFLDLGGSELEGPDGLPLLILHLCDSNRSVGVVTVVLCAADLVLGSEFDLDGVAGGSSCGAAGCCGSSAGGSGRAAGCGQLSCNSRTGQIKNALAQCAKTATTVDIPTGWNPNTKKEPTGLFFAACGRPCSFDSSYGLHETATTLDIPSRWDPRTKQQPTGLIAYPAAQGRPVSGCGSQRMLHALKRRSHPADHGPSFASLFPPLAAVSSTAIPVRVKLKTPLRNAQRQQPH